MAAPSARALLVESAATFVVSAAFPRLWHPERRRRRLRPRRFVVFVGVNLGATYALETWLRPRLEQIVRETDRAKEELRARLGREPTGDEVLAHLGVHVRGG